MSTNANTRSDFQHLQELTVDELQVSRMTDDSTVDDDSQVSEMTDYSALITAKKLEDCDR